ncbi:MAG: arylesterase [Gammaproteobacteria bacterium]|nr:arylesterase [Gammaproteobacteria bacterium]
MAVRSRLILALLFIFAPLHLTAATLLVLGDSISAAYGMEQEEGWVNLLAGQIKQSYPQWQVINGSVSGDTSANALQRLPGLLQSHRPQLVVVEIGGNDGLRGLSLSALRQNLEAITLLLQQRQVATILVAMALPANYGKPFNERFSMIYHDLAAQYQLALLPELFSQIATRPELMQRDQIHPNGAAQPLILQAIWPLVQEQINRLDRP